MLTRGQNPLIRRRRLLEGADAHEVGATVGHYFAVLLQLNGSHWSLVLPLCSLTLLGEFSVQERSPDRAERSLSRLAGLFSLYIRFEFHDVGSWRRVQVRERNGSCVRLQQAKDMTTVNLSWRLEIVELERVNRLESLQFFPVELFFALPRQTFLIFRDLGFESLLRLHDSLEHDEVVGGVVFVQRLHLVQDFRLVSHLGNIVDVSVKDRNMARVGSSPTGLLYVPSESRHHLSQNRGRRLIHPLPSC